MVLYPNKLPESERVCSGICNLQPVQKLPILLLVSEECNTGKSTFLNFLKAVFRNNVTFNTNEDFRSQFNADWAGKLVIVVDEVLLNRREDSERLKNLSTTLGQRNNLRGKSDKFISLPERKSAKVMETSGYRLLLPEGTLDYFIISDVKESSTEIVIYLEEKNEVPGEYSSMQVESKGFYEPVVVQDFPIRGKKLFLNIRRRRWIVKDEGRYVSRNWKLVAEGSRMTHDFASFLKELY